MSNVSYSVLFGDRVGRSTRTCRGTLAGGGWDEPFLRETRDALVDKGVDASIVELTPACDVPSAADACVLVVRNFNPELCDLVLGKLSNTKFDTFTKMYGKVRDAHSRHIVYIDDVAVPPNREECQHSVWSWHDQPELSAVREWMGARIGACDDVTIGCALKYPDIDRCGISWHGDAERRKTALFRLGPNSERHPLHFAWFHKHDRVSDVVSIHLSHGDMVLYSDKAMGYDWKKSSIPTVRHATGFLKQGAHPKMTRGRKRDRIKSVSL
tara:strand:+ start:2368 stop:3174 length:807 start_codon:yes stop_codon:yes gene_type:complete